MKPLQQAIIKMLPDGHDASYHMEVLAKYPEGEWFLPNNADGGNDYSVCNELSYYNLIETKRTPQVVDGRIRGVKISFMYKHDLNY